MGKFEIKLYAAQYMVPKGFGFDKNTPKTTLELKLFLVGKSEVGASPLEEGRTKKANSIRS